MRLRFNHVARTAVAGILLALLGACTTSPTGRSQLMLISPEAAIVESRAAYLSTVGDLDKDGKLVDDPLLAHGGLHRAVRTAPTHR